MPLKCLTLLTNSWVFVISSTQMIWSAILDMPRLFFPFAILYLAFLSCFSFLCFSKSSRVSLFSCLSTSFDVSARISADTGLANNLIHFYSYLTIHTGDRHYETFQSPPLPGVTIRNFTEALLIDNHCI